MVLNMRWQFLIENIYRVGFSVFTREVIRSIEHVGIPCMNAMLFMWCCAHINNSYDENYRFLVSDRR